MTDKAMKAAVIGDGAWGTALALVLQKNGHDTTLWGAFPEYVQEMKESGENTSFLPGVPLPEGLSLTSDPDEAVAGADAVIIASPTKYYSDVVARFKDAIRSDAIVVSVSKGLDRETGDRMSVFAQRILGRKIVAALSGPSHAEEVARETPAAVVVAADDPEVAESWSNLLNNDRFRVYTSHDVVGVELGGALKNVVAIAAGVCDGIGFGDNAKAALITRGIAEISRLGCALGADPRTFFGLSGVGDLIVTCGSKLSRNRDAGERLGRGERAEDILAGALAVEGMWNCEAAYRLASKHKVEVPITAEVYAIVHQGKDPHEAVESLLSRPARPE